MVAVNPNEYLKNRHYDSAEHYEKLIAELRPRMAKFMEEFNENSDLNIFSQMWEACRTYKNEKPYAGKRLIAEIERDFADITCAKSLSLKPLPPDGIEVAGLFKNLVFVDKTSYRKALRLPPIYFNLRRTNYSNQNHFYTPIRNAYQWTAPSRRYMPQPHCRIWNEPCYGDFSRAINTAFLQYDVKTLVPLLRDFLCAGGGHSNEMLHLTFGDPKIRFYSLSEMERGHSDSGTTRWCPTYSRWGKLRGTNDTLRFYISPNEWLPVTADMEFTEYNVRNLVPCETLRNPMPDVKALVQFDPHIHWRESENGTREMWRWPLYTPSWKVRLSVLEREKLARKAKELLESQKPKPVAAGSSLQLN